MKKKGACFCLSAGMKEKIEMLRVVLGLRSHSETVEYAILRAFNEKKDKNRGADEN